MTDIETLHDEYMKAVIDALEEHGRMPNKPEWGRISDGEHLDAVFNYGPRNTWEHGVTVYWDERTGWQYTALDEHGRGTHAEDLPIEFLAAPGAVARAVSKLLPDRLESHPGSTERWEHADQLQAALDEEATA
ncbi:DUF6292 family protein [Streptomyces sp. NPDC002853]